MTPRLLRFGVWFVFAAAVTVVAAAGYYHFFGAGYFRPVINVEVRRVHLGKVSPDENAPCEFTVTNKGYRPLVIEQVHPGCSGCIEVVDFPKEPLRRNQSAVIKVNLVTKTLKGNTRKTVLVDSNDPRQPVYSLLIDADAESNKPASKPSGEPPQKQDE